MTFTFVSLLAIFLFFAIFVVALKISNQTLHSLPLFSIGFVWFGFFFSTSIGFYFRLIKWSVFGNQTWKNGKYGKRFDSKLEIGKIKREKSKEKKTQLACALLTHRGNVAWQTEEVCTWHLWLVWVALHSVPRIVADHPVRPGAASAIDHFRCHFCDDRAIVRVTLNAVAAIEPANDVIFHAVTPVIHSCAVAMNACHCVRCDWE